MKRKIVLSAVLVSVLMLLVIGLFWSTGAFEKALEKEDEGEKNIGDLCTCVLESLEFSSIYKLTGRVVCASGSEIYGMDLSCGSSGIAAAKENLGKDFLPGDVLFGFDAGKTVNSPVNGKLVDFYCTNDGTDILTLNFLDYSSLVIETEIDEKGYRSIGYNSPVKVTIDNRTYDSSINRIGYEIRNGKVGLTIDLPERMLPGTEVEIEITSASSKKALWLNSDFITWDGSCYYVLKLVDTDSGEYEKTVVNIGDTTEVVGNSTVWTYYEIVSGLLEGDTVCFENNW